MKKNIFIEGVDSYSINFLINNLNKTKKQVIDESIIKNVINSALKWAKENKEEDKAKINIWFDIKLFTAKQLDDFSQLAYTLSKLDGCNEIHLHNLNKIKFIEENKFLLDNNISLSFRTNFLKLIIIAHELITERNDGAIFSNNSICKFRRNENGEITGKTFSKAELFDENYMNMMEEFGVINNLRELNYPGNEFIQMVNDEKSVNALRHIINASLMRTVICLNNLETALYMNNMIVCSIESELSKFYRASKTGNIKINAGFFKNSIPDDQWETYNSEIHKYIHLGNAFINSSNNFMIVDSNLKIICKPLKTVKYEITNGDDFGTRDCFITGSSRSDDFGTRDCFIIGSSRSDDLGMIDDNETYTDEGKTYVASYWTMPNEVEAMGTLLQ